MSEYQQHSDDDRALDAGWDLEILCGARIDVGGTAGRLCNRTEGHQGPHDDSPIPMGMTGHEWDKFVRSYR